MGCGEFNPLTDEDRDNRRVTLAIYGDDEPSDDDFPCKHGDAGACQIDSGGRFTCKFYRERLRDEDVEHELTPFWDFDWLKTLSGKAHLSALTHLPDTDDAMFSVRVVEGGRQPRDDTGSGAPPSYGVTVATLPGLIRNGVAYALWSHDTNYAPFDQRRWFRVPGETDDARPWLAPYLPPVFVVASQGHWGVSEGPGLRLSRAREQGDSERPRLIVCTSGKIALVRDSASTPANSEIRTTSLLVAGSAVRVEGAK
jgi:hypothetical protein